ncbi:HD domain-containing protein [archaeon]|jgi:3'-5' exoribonuclease|nr:HD domain-containing protein [archaeon]MBT3451519.1 HD domain-containing protein [archaeon]MBT6869511.1 HD domain-containing protein [archaeon]MBT7193199.1 HD domain-containing protein [archaeon]MBT7380505.1 HD domain-containing protein [archaeon]
MYQKKQLIKNLNNEDIVNDIFVIKSKKNVISYANKTKFRFELRVADSSGEIDLKYWGSNDHNEVQSIHSVIKENSVIQVVGKINEFNNILEISTNQIKILNETEFDSSSFIEKNNKNIEEMFQKLNDHLDSITDLELKQLVKTFLQDQLFVNKFKTWPGSNYRHHAYIGGLLEHTLNVMEISLRISKNNPELNQDLLVIGSFLHDIGKLKSLSLSISIKTTNEGITQGTQLLGLKLFEDKIKSLHIPKQILLKLQNIILSSPGKKEYGAIKLPLTPEALTISLAKETDTKINSMLKIRSNSETDQDFVYNKEFGNVYLK